MSNVLVPRGWVQTTLSEIVAPGRVRRLPAEVPNLPFVGMEHVESQTMRLLGTVPAERMKSSAVHFQAGDVLYGRLRPYLNKVLRPSFEGLSSAEFIVFPGDGTIYAPWLSLLLNSSMFVSFASHLNEGDRPRVDFDQIGGFELLLPPRREQERIASEVEALFGDLDAAMATLKRVQSNLKRYRASVLKAACEGRLVPTESELARKEGRTYETGEQLLARILKERRAKWEADQLAKMLGAGKPPTSDNWKRKYREPALPNTYDLPRLPEGWTWTTAGYMFECIVPNRDKPKSFTGEVPWITLPDFDDGIEIAISKSGLGLSDEETKEYRARVVPKGSVIMSCVGRFGLTAVVGTPVVINQQLHAFVMSLLVSARYIAYALRTQTSYMESLSTATTIAYLNKDNCNSVPLPIPPASEQERIAAELDRRLSVVANLEGCVDQAIARADRLRQAILKRAFEGKLVPQDPNNEPASVLLERIRAKRAITSERPRNQSRRRQCRAAVVVEVK